MRFTRRLGLMAVSALALSVVVSCGKGGPDPKVAQVKPGDMPADGAWSGVYYDQYFGNLHLVEQGDTVSGAWRTEAGDRWGEMTGQANGNLLKYDWKEHKIGMVGPSANSTGKGYFVYKSSDTERDPDFIQGERGNGDSEVGQNWKAVKQVNKKPNPASVKPDEVESHGTGGAWDDGEGDEKKKESSGGTEDSSSDSE